MRLLSIVVLMTAVAGLCPAAVPAAANDPAQSVDELFKPVAGGKSPGASVAVLRDGQVVFMKAYGMADVEKGVPNSPATIFRLASVTKTFTAIAVLQLVESGKLKLDDTLSKYVPEFPNSEKIQISQLLSHMAGVPDFVSLEEAGRKGLEFAPGTRINYSNNGYHLLGKVIEKVSGQPWDEYLKQRIFTPLGMLHTGYDNTPSLAGRATPYVAGADGAYAAIPLPDAREAYAGGGLYSTVEDMARWVQALPLGKLLRPETLELATTPGTLADGRRTSYGYGWMTSTFRGLREVGHGGDITGYNSFVARYPDEKLTVIVLENMGMRPAGPLPDAVNLAHQIAEIWLAGRLQKPEARPNFAVSVSTLDSYAGRFKLDAPDPVIQAMGRFLTFVRDGDRLAAEVNGQKVPLDAKSETVFQAFGSPAVLTFIAGRGGKSPEVVVTLMGLREFHAFRAEP